MRSVFWIATPPPPEALAQRVQRLAADVRYLERLAPRCTAAARRLAMVHAELAAAQAEADAAEAGEAAIDSLQV